MIKYSFPLSNACSGKRIENVSGKELTLIVDICVFSSLLFFIHFTSCLWKKIKWAIYKNPHTFIETINDYIILNQFPNHSISHFIHSIIHLFIHQFIHILAGLWLRYIAFCVADFVRTHQLQANIQSKLCITFKSFSVNCMKTYDITNN